MKVSLLVLQVALMICALAFTDLTTDVYLSLYFADFACITAYFMSTLTPRNWYLDKGYFLILLYTIYYPLTALLIVLNGLDVISPEFTAMQSQFSVLFICSFTLAYLTISRFDRGMPLKKGNHLFAKGYSNAALVLVIFAPSVVKLLSVWFTVGGGFEYNDVYTTSYDLEASGLNIVNQITNVLSSFSVVALIMFFVKEVGRGRFRHCALTLVVFLGISIYLGARTTFLAPLLTYLVVYGSYVRFRPDAKSLLVVGLVAAFYFGLEAYRTTLSTQGADAQFLLSEPFMIFSNGLSLYGPDASTITRPELNSYVNDVIKILPNYVYATGVDISRWYVQEFYPVGYAHGSGLAFGFNAEAMLNAGEASIVFQSVSLGVIFGLLGHIKLTSKWGNEYLQVIGIQLVVGAYSIVRVTTFSFLAIIGSTAIALVMIRMLHIVVSAGGTRAAIVAESSRG